jgi:2-methylcitrate dehydratase PrpD
VSHTDRLAAFCAELSLAALPSDVVERTKLCVLDGLGTMLAGSTAELGRQVLAAAARFDSSTIASVIGTSRRVSPTTAAMVNATAAEIFELQDGWRFGNDHPSVVIPAALAVGEWMRSSGADVLASIVAGYEVTNRLAWSVHPNHLARGFLPTGTAGTCGSAVTAGRLLGFDAARMKDALGVAGFLLPVSTAENLWAGYSAKPLHSGQAAKTGIEAALLAAEGFSGCGVEGTSERGRGFLEITTGEVKLDRIVDRLGTHFTVRDVYFKIFPACRHAHGAAEAACQLAAQGARLETVETVRVHTYELAASLLDRYTDEASGIIACQFSIPYVVAAALADGALGVDQFSDERIHDAQILDLARRVKVVADADLTGLYPSITPTRVEATLTDGRVVTARVDMPRGDPRTPLDEAELTAKFQALAGLVLNRPRLAKVKDTVLGLERLSDVRDLTALLDVR